MTNKSQNYRQFIVDYFESLRSELDIYTADSLKIGEENETLDEKISLEKNRIDEIDSDCEYNYDNSDCQTIEPMAIITFSEYFNKTRDRVERELKQLEKETLEYYDKNSSRLIERKVDNEKLKLDDDDDELKSQLFANKFCFMLKLDDISSHTFKLTTIIVDFYLSFKHIQYLKYIIELKFQFFSARYYFFFSKNLTKSIAYIVLFLFN